MKTAIDPFFGVSSNDVTAPTRKSAVVAPDPLNDLPYVTKQLIITATTGGNVAWVDPDALDSSSTVVNFAAGTYVLTIQVRRIFLPSGSTFAGTIVALWG